jgi:hypothetical protein
LPVVNDTNTGLYSPGAAQLAISTNGTKRLEIQADGDIQLGGSSGVFFDATNNRLAIGTTSPSQALNVVSPTTQAVFEGSTQGNIIIQKTGAAGFGIYSDAAGTLSFYDNNASSLRARIDSSGRLLVGTSTAVTGANASISKLNVIGNSSNSAGNAVAVIGRGAAASTLSAGNDVGAIFFTDNGSNEFAAIACQVDAATGAADAPGRIVLSTTASGASSPTERMRINSSGALKQQGAGSSLENSAGDYSEFNNNAIGTTALLQRCTSGSFTGAVSVLKSVKAANTDFQFIAAEANAVVRFNVRGDGNVTNTNNSYGAISDIKLKENIVDANSQWDDLKALQVRNYNFKEGQTHTQIGLVAQEAELVSPGLVSESPDRDADGNDLGTVTKSVNYSVLYMKAVKALQEAMERIETLEADVAALKAQ